MSSTSKFLSAVGRFTREAGGDLVNPGRKFSYLKRWFRLNYVWIARQPSIPSVTPESLIPGLKTLVLPVELRFGMWNVTPLELYYLAGLTHTLQPRRIFEFGTYDGASTLQMARMCPKAELFTIDLPEGEKHFEVGSRFVDQPERARIQSLRGDSTAYDYSPYAGSMDFVFIDGGHDFEVVDSDTKSALKMASPEAAILWHDYLSFAGVKRVVDELAKTRPVVHIKGTEFALLRLGKTGPTPLVDHSREMQEGATWVIGDAT